MLSFLRNFVLQVDGKPEKIEIENVDEADLPDELIIPDDELFEDTSDFNLNDEDI